MLLFGIAYYFISLKNRTLENLKYNSLKNKGNKDCKIEVNASLMQIDFNKEGISKELIVNKKREIFTTDFMKEFIQENEIVIDIGANIGYYALLEAKVASKGKVYATEPVPYNNEILRRNVRCNNYSNISVFTYAIGNRNGQGKMNVYDKSNWCSFTDNLENLNSEIIKEIEVPLMTMDSFIKENVKQYPTLIRMDVEGYEHQIIKGMSNLLGKNKPLKILMELHPPWLGLMSKEEAEEMINTLKKNGFKIRAIFAEVAPYNYRSIKLINTLREFLNLPTFGLTGKSYEDLDKLLKQEDIYTPQVLFERN